MSYDWIILFTSHLAIFRRPAFIARFGVFSKNLIPNNKHMKTIAHMAVPLFLLISSLSPAAEAPKSQEKLETTASHIVRGKVIEVTSKVEKSKIKTYHDTDRDTIYTITVQVEKVSKGDEAKQGEQIAVLAWTPHTREPNGYIVESMKQTPIYLPGRQGQDLIPKKGDNATFYLTGGGKEPFELLTPNGVAVDKAK